MARQFQVPQFIEVEDKLFGPFTFKQFVYLAGGGGLAYMAFQLMPTKTSGFIAAAPFVLLALALAFIKIQERPFPLVLEAAAKYFFGKKLYLWHQQVRKETPKPASNIAPVSKANIPKISESKLHDLSWSIGLRKEGQEHAKM